MRLPLLVPDLDALDAALASGADALVFDLAGGLGRMMGEDPRHLAALSSGDRGPRRRGLTDALKRSAARPSPPRLVVRVAALTDGLVDDDLDVAISGAPDTILLPDAVGRADIQHLAAKLAVAEAEHGWPPGRTGIAALAAASARGVLALPTIPGASPRLRALFWDGAALAADLGVEADAAPCRLGRSLLVVAAAAAGVPAIDCGSGDGEADLVRACDAARRDGFAGRLARTPGEVEVIAGRFGHRR